ncbi:MAG: hypothetical protein PHR26_03985 [Candidatus ainarchaeum sp.]|nr:hypothetical protein [Candidatus ainarchaeum sp.]
MDKINQQVSQQINIDKLFVIKKLPITSKEKNGIFEAWVESSDL